MLLTLDAGYLHSPVAVSQSGLLRMSSPLTHFQTKYLEFLTHHRFSKEVKDLSCLMLSLYFSCIRTLYGTAWVVKQGQKQTELLPVTAKFSILDPFFFLIKKEHSMFI